MAQAQLVSWTKAMRAGRKINFMTLPHIKISLFQARIWLFSAICFALPMKANLIYIPSALLLCVWIAEGRLGEKTKEILHSKLCLAFLAYYSIYILAMLWTEDVSAGWGMVDRQTPFLLFLLYWSCAEREYRERYIVSLIGGAAVCALLAHYNWLQLHWFPEWPRGVRVFKSPEDTAPFVDWIMYTPILALATYFSLRYIFVTTSSTVRVSAIAISCLLISNLAFSGGRAGMVMFAALCIALIFELIRARLKALLFCLISFPLVFFAAYNTHELFSQRVDKGIADIRNFDQDQNTSVGQRFVYWTTSFMLFSQNPVFGVGSGDLQKEYARIKPERWKATPDPFNPHNQLLMTGVTTGLLGIISLMFIFYYAARSGADRRMNSFLIGFFVVCLFESYLWRSNTSLTFVVIMAALSEKNKKKLLL